MAYTRMALVRPDLVGKSDTPSSTATTTTTHTAPANAAPPAVAPDPQTHFYETQVVREKLSPHSSLVGILSHLQKEAVRVLNDSQLNVSERLSRYNQIMTKSSILYKKARIVSRAASHMNPRTVKRRKKPRVETPQEADDEDSSDTDDMFSTTSRRTAPPSGSDSSSSGEEEMEQEEQEEEDEEGEEDDSGDPMTRQGVRFMDNIILKNVPSTYQQNAMKLYKHLASADKGSGTLNWTTSGQLVVGGRIIPGSNIVHLLADAARRNSLAVDPVGKKFFVAAVKRLNPDLKYVRNKDSFKQASTRSITAPGQLSPFTTAEHLTPSKRRGGKTVRSSRGKGKSKSQSGSGVSRRTLAKLWRTKL